MNSVVTAYPNALPEATSTSLSLPESLTFEQWEEIGAELANRAKKLNWWIGDWWAAGHHRYGERARLAARGLFGKEFKTLANIASVCRAFEPSRRREHLSWSHHAEAAALSPNAADMLLDLAERDRMSKAQVRAAVTTIRGGPPSRTAPDEVAVAGLFRAYNRLPGEVRILVAQAFAAANGAEIDPSTGEPKAEPTPEEGWAEAEIAFVAESEMVMSPAEPAIETEQETEPAGGAWQTEAEPETVFNLAPDLEAPEVQPEPEAVLDLASDTEVPSPHAETYTTFDLAEDIEAPTMGAEPEIAFDLTLDMAALQADVGTETPLELASEMEAELAAPEPDTAFDLELDMALSSEETAAGSAFDLDPAMELAEQSEDTLDLDPAMEKKEGAEEPSSKRSEPWLLP